VIIVVIAYGIYQLVRVRRLAQAGKQLAQTAVPYQRVIPDASFRVLVIGDSTAYGTGADSPETSVTGRLGTEFPGISIENQGKNGARVADLLATFNPSPETHYNLLIIHVGGNDILHATSLAHLRRDLPVLTERAKKFADHVIFITSGDFGSAPILPWPVNYLYSLRTQKVRQIFLASAEATDTLFADIYKEEKTVSFKKETDEYYAVDGFHPSSHGYEHWYVVLHNTLYDGQVPLPGLQSRLEKNTF
jgi:lysophospholipase L1-like esterase